MSYREPVPLPSDHAVNNAMALLIRSLKDNAEKAYPIGIHTVVSGQHEVFHCAACRITVALEAAQRGEIVDVGL